MNALTREQMDTLRLQYAGAIGLLCELSLHIRPGPEKADYLDNIEQAAMDFCALTGWKHKRVIERIEVSP